MSAHVGEDAELYALGLLDAERRAEVDAHAAACDDCLRALGEAEETAALLAAALPELTPSRALGERLRAATTPANSPVTPLRRPSARSPRWFAGLAVAAALVLALGAGWYQSSVMHGKLQANDVAVAMLVHSHFSHVPMTTTAAGERSPPRCSTLATGAGSTSWSTARAENSP